jgi:acyl-CoA reductase-like NAD-dependent aldehyde dehydrogenase
VQLYCVQDADQAVDLHEQLEFRVSTSIFTGDEAAAIALSKRLTTGATFVNRGTSTTSLRLPSVGRGRSTNAVATPTELVRALTVPAALLVDRRPYDDSRFVPGAGSLPASPRDGRPVPE